MEEEEIYAWVALLAIFIIPLASIAPRILRKIMKNKEKEENLSQRTIISEKRQFQSSNNDNKYAQESEIKSSSSTTLSAKNKLVLGELVRGANTFEKIQKNTKLSNKELDEILGNLEKNAMLQVQQKKGLLGIKIELYPTDKGFKKYYS